MLHITPSFHADCDLYKTFPSLIFNIYFHALTCCIILYLILYIFSRNNLVLSYFIHLPQVAGTSISSLADTDEWWMTKFVDWRKVILSYSYEKPKPKISRYGGLFTSTTPDLPKKSKVGLTNTSEKKYAPMFRMRTWSFDGNDTENNIIKCDCHWSTLYV